jgi:hypothetical protein
LSQNPGDPPKPNCQNREKNKEKEKPGKPLFPEMPRLTDPPERDKERDEEEKKKFPT